MQYVELQALYVKTVLTLASALHVMHKPSGIFAEEKTLKNFTTVLTTLLPRGVGT